MMFPSGVWHPFRRTQPRTYLARKKIGAFKAMHNDKGGLQLIARELPAGGISSLAESTETNATEIYSVLLVEASGGA